MQCSAFHMISHNFGMDYSRIQSLKFDNIAADNLLIARAMGNNKLNKVMEASIGNAKLNPRSSSQERCDFIRAKYVEMRYVIRTFSNDSDLLNGLEQSIKNADLGQLLQVWAEGVDLTAVLPSSRLGETALHLAVLRETGLKLHIVDFLIQNMSFDGLNKTTNITNMPDLPGKNTALHLCALHDRQECMKLLLRLGADFELKNEQGKTALAITKEMGNDMCRELIESAIRRQKGFDHIHTEWNLSHDNGSTDFSDDDTVVDEKKRSRPPSYAGGESPVAITRSPSSTCVSIQSRSSPNAVSYQFQRQMSNQLSATYAQSSTTPKQQNSFPQQRRLSPSMSNITKNYAQAANLSNRKSLSSSKMEKCTVSIPSNQTIYSTLSNAPRHSQGNDGKEIHNMNKIQSDTYSTLPQVRKSDAKQSLDEIFGPLTFEVEIETPEKYEKQQKYSDRQQPSEFTIFENRSLSLLNHKLFSSSKMDKCKTPSPKNDLASAQLVPQIDNIEREVGMTEPLKSNATESKFSFEAKSSFGSGTRCDTNETDVTWQCERCTAQNDQMSDCICGEANPNGSTAGYSFSSLPSFSTIHTEALLKAPFTFGSPSFQFVGFSNTGAMSTATATVTSASPLIFGSSSQASTLSFKSVSVGSTRPSPSTTLADFRSSSTTLEPISMFSFGQSATKLSDNSVQIESNIDSAKITDHANAPESATMKGADKICVKCGYTTDHSGHFNLHKIEGCKKIAAVKDRNCPVCCQPYTYNQLRYHIRQYLTDTSKAKNGHQNFSPEEHVKMLKKLKEEKKLSIQREKSK